MVVYQAKKAFMNNEAQLLVAALNYGRNFHCNKATFTPAENRQLLAAFRKIYARSSGTIPRIPWYRRAIWARRVGLAGTILIATYYERRFRKHRGEVRRLRKEILQDLECRAYQEDSTYQKEVRLRSRGALESVADECEACGRLLYMQERELAVQKTYFAQQTGITDLALYEKLFSEDSAEFAQVYDACAGAISGIKLTALLDYCPLCLNFAEQMVVEETYQSIHRMLLVDTYTSHRLNDYETGR